MPMRRAAGGNSVSRRCSRPDVPSGCISCETKLEKPCAVPCHVVVIGVGMPGAGTCERAGKEFRGSEGPWCSLRDDSDVTAATGGSGAILKRVLKYQGIECGVPGSSGARQGRGFWLLFHRHRQLPSSLTSVFVPRQSLTFSISLLP